MTLLDVIQRIAPGLNENNNIYAMWIEGSWATGKNNDGSDIDVWLDVANDTFDVCIDAFRDELVRIGTIDWEKSRGIYSEQPKLTKHTFHLQNFSEKQVVELDLQEKSRDFIFNKDEHTIKIIFDKNHSIKWQ
ncbi:hypothetical protein BH23PAT2_BH23PAT2_07950 [soil metagenome]